MTRFEATLGQFGKALGRFREFVDIRNETAHAYNENFADEVYGQLPNVLEHFEILYNKLL